MNHYGDSSTKKLEPTLVRFGSVYFYRYGDLNVKNESSVPLILIPGGPWISGEYLNELSESLHVTMNSVVYRAVLPNHEVDHGGLSSHIEFSKLILLIKQSIELISNKHKTEPILVGHSFGSVILANILVKDSLPNSGVILISSPLSLENWVKFSVLLESNNIPNYSGELTDANFIVWWKMAAPLYFLRPDQPALSLLTNKTFVGGNTSQASGVANLEDVYAKVADLNKARKNNIYLIEGDSDPIGLAENLSILSRQFGPGLRVIESSGHFPMIENKVATLEAIEYAIKRLTRRSER